MSLRPALCLVLLLCACEPEPEPDPFGEDPGPPPQDACNTQDDAANVAECALTLGSTRQEFIGLPGDVDWFSARMPSGLTARSLLHVAAGYSTPATSVNLSLNVLREAGASIAAAVDKHGQAAPKPIDLTVRFAESGARVMFFLGDDQSGKHYDYRSPYALKVEVIDDPDTNEPNDATPTPLPLVQNGDRLTGTQKGWLATTDDIDRFALQLPAGRKVLHLRITGPKLEPAANYRMSYTLFDAAGTPVAEGKMANEFLAVELATARAVNGGSYVLELKGYRAEVLQKVPGDLRLQYSIEAQLLDELDANEPNDTLQTATARPLTGPGQSATWRGRLSEIGDPDWFAVDLPALSRPTTLHYKLTPGAVTGRFPPLPGPVDRQLRLFTEVTTGATLGERQLNCKTRAASCPRRDDAPADQLGLADSYCAMTPPRCMWSAREEHLKFQALKNFEGAVPVAAHPASQRWYVVFEDEGSNWADDREYTLTVSWREDADETSRMSGSTEQTQVRALALDSAASGFPAPPQGAAFELSGTLSYGYGYWRHHDALEGEGVRGPDDYDAFSSDGDRYELQFPAGLSAPLDRTWELQWEVEKVPNGRPPYDVAIEVEFCDGAKSTTSCSPVRRTLGYTGGNLGAWHSAGQQGVSFQPVYSREDLANSVRVTALAWGCFCFEPRFVAGRKFFLKVVAVDRDSYADLSYRVRAALTSYPKPYNGGSCPAPAAQADGGWAPGCNFTK
jgi:hypothetical protein